MATEAVADLNGTNDPQGENHTQTVDTTDVPTSKTRRAQEPSSKTTSSSTQPPRPSSASASEDDASPEGEESKGSTVASVADGVPVSDVQKKILRAERFGITVQLSEQEKRNSRAERFGTSSSANGPDVSKKSEELKRKARAERFGISNPSVVTDEDTKKKARLARFSSVPKADSVEEEKRKARAMRFSDPPSSSLSQGTDKGNIHPKAAIAGKAGGVG